MCQGALPITRHVRRGDYKMDIMRVIGVGIAAFWPGLRHIGFVDFDRRLVHHCGVLVTTKAEKGMRAHMHQMPSPWHEGCQAVGVGLGALWRGRGFGQMDVEMNGPRMVGMLRQHMLRGADDLTDLAP